MSIPQASAKEILAPFAQLNIDWDMTPELAVTLYLEWGNNNWRSTHPPVRSREDVSIYFVVDAWGDTPVVRLVQRNMDAATDLTTLALPQELAQDFREEYGTLKGVFEPQVAVKTWLKGLLGQDESQFA